MRRRNMKPLAAFACAAVATVALTGCAGISEMYTSQNETQRILNSESKIGEAGARQIALDHAGLAEEDVTIVHEGRATDYERLVHEIEFYKGAYEYDYAIDAETGQIVSFDEDAEHYVIADWHRNTPPSTDSSDYIGEDAAKTAALDDAGLAESDVANMRVALDYDERVPRYEVEFDTDELSYQYEIYATDGKVMSFETARL